MTDCVLQHFKDKQLNLIMLILMQHRGERRGLGGIFFDDLNKYDQEMLLSFATGNSLEELSILLTKAVSDFNVFAYQIKGQHFQFTFC